MHVCCRLNLAEMDRRIALHGDQRFAAHMRFWRGAWLLYAFWKYPPLNIVYYPTIYVGLIGARPIILCHGKLANLFSRLFFAGVSRIFQEGLQ